MAIIAIGTPQALKQAQDTEELYEKPSLRLIKNMEATPEDAPFEVWNGHAAEAQKIGYVSVWLDVFYGFRNSPKGFTALRQKVVSGATAECREKFASKHYFEAERLDRTMKRIGAIYMLAQKDKRENHVRFAFAPILAGHGINVAKVAPYLVPQIAVAGPAESKREVHQERGLSERPSRSVVKMFENAPEPARIAVRADGTSYLLKAKHKPIVALTSEERADREKQHASEKFAAEKKRAEKAQKAAQQAKEKKKNSGKRK
ncbi:MAG: hypothetical protein Q7S52_00310 [bacterium]|nr:hypothetical protein [bacterium]